MKNKKSTFSILFYLKKDKMMRIPLQMYTSKRHQMYSVERCQMYI